MPFLRLLLVVLIFASPAAAEVCDKVAGDGWTPDQGPINVLTMGKGLGWLAAFVLIAMVITLTGSRRLAWVAAFLTALAAVFPGLMTWLGNDDMTQAAIREGCWGEISTLSATMVALFFTLAAAFFVGMTRGRFVLRPRR